MINNAVTHSRQNCIGRGLTVAFAGFSIALKLIITIHIIVVCTKNIIEIENFNLYIFTNIEKYNT